MIEQVPTLSLRSLSVSLSSVMLNSPPVGGWAGITLQYSVLSTSSQALVCGPTHGAQLWNEGGTTNGFELLAFNDKREYHHLTFVIVKIFAFDVMSTASLLGITGHSPHPHPIPLQWVCDWILGPR